MDKTPWDEIQKIVEKYELSKEQSQSALHEVMKTVVQLRTEIEDYSDIIEDLKRTIKEAEEEGYTYE